MSERLDPGVVGLVLVAHSAPVAEAVAELVSRLAGASVPVAAAGGTGRDRLWDLASRIYPDDPVPPVEEAHRLRDQRRLRSLGIARAKGPKLPFEPVDVGESGEEATVEGVTGIWRVDPGLLAGLGDVEPRTALLSPFDRLVFDRGRAQELFGFEYLLEMYKPAAQRRWGYFALPILRGDALIGKLDVKADRKAGVLRVAAIHRDAGFTDEAEADVRGEIADLAGWLGLLVEKPT